MPRFTNIERFRWLVPYIVLVVAATLLLIALRIPFSRLDVPFAFFGDAIDKLAQIANVAETGWLFHNDRLGFPFGYDRLDFPRFDSLNYALIGPLATLISPAAAMNIYYIASFYLIAFAAYWSLRRLGLALAPAMLCALLYAFLPYHVIRGVGHLTNAAYFLVPLAFVALTWLALGRLDTQTADARRRLVFAVAIAVLVPLQMPYNGVFLAYLTVVAAAIAIGRGMRWRNAAVAAALVAVTGLAFVVEQLPVTVHALQVGKPSLTAERAPAEAELYAMRLNQLLMPTTLDRRHAAARATAAFDETMAVPETESRDQYIGVIGVIGFLALVWALCRAVGARAPPTVAPDGTVDAETAARIAALFAIALLLLAISTGLGTLVSYWITSKIRAYNRVLPFFAFACLVGGGWALQAGAERIRIGWLRNALLVIVAIVALHDSLLAPPYPNRARGVVNYDRAREYFEGVERRLGKNAAVLQLPASWYPEHPPIGEMGDYEEFKPFLLTRTLRFSYGVGRGRPGYSWNKYVDGLPPKDAIATAHAKGFAAILIDGHAYDDAALKAMTDALAAALPKAPSVNPDRRWWLFPLDGCCADNAPRAERGRDAGLFAYTIGSAPMDFSAGGDGVLYDAGGWRDPEPWGTWSSDAVAKLRVRFDPAPAGAIELALNTRMMLGPKMPERTTTISANGHHVADATYTLTTASQTLHIELVPGAIGADGVLELDFETTPPASPRSAGTADDGRPLGVGLETLSISAKDRAR